MDRTKGSFVDPVQRAVRQTERELRDYSSVCLLDAASRPDNGGREGKLISVVANLFPVKFNPDLLITQFDVRFVKTKQLGQDGKEIIIDVIEKRPIMLALFQLALEKINGLTKKERTAIIYDGAKNAFTCTTFPFPPGQVSVETELSSCKLKKDEKLKMIIKKTSHFSINAIKDFISATPEFVRKAQKATTDSVCQFLQIFNIAFRMDLLQERYSIKNEKFFDPEKAIAIAQGAEIWRGIYQNVSAFRGGLFVNLDLTNRPFMCKGPFLEVAARILERKDNSRGDASSRRGGGGCGDTFSGHDASQRRGDNEGNAIRHLSMMDLQKLRKALRDVKIGLIHRPQGRSRTFKGFTGASARAEMFHWNGKEISVAEYYLAKYGTTLKHPDLPCAILGQNTNNPEKKQWV